MDGHEKIISGLKLQGMLPLFYHDDQEHCLQVTASLYKAGVRYIEFTNRGEGALNNFKAIVAESSRSMKDLVLGVGTVRNAADASTFIDAGAGFLVSPVFDAAVCDVAYLRKILWIPGCMSPTEIHVAAEAGCRLIKLFPGNVLGPAFVSAISPLFPGIDFMPTGGVEMNEENLAAWFNAGVCAVGMGSRLISKKFLDTRDYKSIKKNTEEILTTIASVRNNHD